MVVKNQPMKPKTSHNKYIIHINSFAQTLAFHTLDPKQSSHFNTLIDSVYQVSPIHMCQHMRVVLTPRLLILGLGLGTWRASV